MIVLNPAPPYKFTGPYSGCYSLPEVAMDKRHVYLLRDILCAWPFESMLEIGCFNGASSTAFVEAINHGAPGTITLCDVSLSDSLVDVVSNCRHPERIRVTQQPSWAVLDSQLPFDFILVDAAHDIDSVSLELKRLLRRRPLCVMAHDTSAADAGYSKCEGAKLLKDTFASLDGYHCVEDNQRRDGERTERGLLLATRDHTLLRIAQELFEKWK